MPLPSGTRLGSYEILAPLGAGGMGEVYRARDTRLGRDVAIKVLPRGVASGPQDLDRFRREARTLASLQHPGIVSIFAVEEDDGIPFLAMELVEGRSLASEIVAGGQRPARVLELAIAMSGALAAAHANGIVHRDLKPDNIMLGVDDRVRLLDFGLATPAGGSPAVPDPGAATVAMSDALTQAGTLMGTVAYMSPEQAQGFVVGPASDVFSLGIVLTELATGVRPFVGRDAVSTLAAILRDAAPRCDTLASSFPGRFADIVHRCLEKDPRQRWASATELHAALVELEAWPRTQGVPQLLGIVDRIQGLEEGPEAWEAFVLAREIASLAPDEPQLARVRPWFERVLSITSDPPGARVLVRYYGAPESEWTPMGVTPLLDVAWPKGFTRVRLELEGRRPAHDVLWNIEFVGSAFEYLLPEPGTFPDEMEWVPAGTFAVFMPGLDHLEPEPMAGFLMDRDPVTNREFRRFVDAGGYRDPRWWTEPIRLEDRELPHAEAMRRFVDETGQCGPAGWEAGACAPGEEDLPVTGVCWHEAAAYAAWAGKSLPTIFHWNRVAFTCASAQIIRHSNLAGRRLLPVDSTHGWNRFGVRDLAGNVREWARNASSFAGKRFLLGGGWNDPDYSFTDAWAQPELDRGPTNGFRCMRHVEAEPNLHALARTIESPTRDFRAEIPVPDAVFEYFLRQFRYDPAPLAARIEADEPTVIGRMQTVTMAAAYGGERLTCYVFLPEGVKPPYQVVAIFPGSNAIHARVFNPFDLRRLDFIVRTGRAAILPVFKGTYHRGGDLHSDYPTETAAYRDYVVAWGRDLGRALDYVETRDDLDASRIAYFGLSWGGHLGAIMPAIEKRIRANVLYVAGLTFQKALPEADAIHYIGRVTQPTLMLNGELDFFFPVETSQKPMFELLGAAPEHKERVTYPGGHSVPRPEMIRHSLAWLDRYLGPVK